jgi:hypothetical protein
MNQIINKKMHLLQVERLFFLLWVCKLNSTQITYTLIISSFTNLEVSQDALVGTLQSKFAIIMSSKN